MGFSHDLTHELIHSLSKGQKKYFSIHADKAGDPENPILILFRILNRMNNYDEGRFKKKIKREIKDGKKRRKIINDLSKWKSKLYGEILRCMRAYNAGSNPVLQIKEMITDATFLRDLGLNEQAMDLLEKAKKQAGKFGHETSLLEIIREEQSLIWSSQEKMPEQKLNQLVKEKRLAFTRLDLEIRNEDLYHRIYLNRSSADENIQERIRLQLNELSRPENIDRTSKPGILRNFQSNGLYFRMIGKKEESYNYFKKALDWWSEQAHFQKADLFRYRLTLNNYLSTCLKIQKFKEVEKTIQQLGDKKQKTEGEKALVFRLKANNELVMYLSTDQWDEAEKLLPALKSKIQKTKNRLQWQVPIFHNIGIAHFLQQNYTESHEWFKKIRKEFKKVIRKEFQRMAWIFPIILYYQMEDLDKAQRAYRSARRFLRKDEEVNPNGYEYTILAFLWKIISRPESEKTVYFTSFLKKLKEFNRKSIALEELTIWIQSHLQGKTMKEVFQGSIQAAPSSVTQSSR